MKGLSWTTGLRVSHTFRKVHQARRRLRLTSFAPAATSARRVAGFQLQIRGRMACMPVKRGPGRPSKGPRDHFAVRPPVPVGAVIRANAKALGMDYGEYIAAVVSTALGMPEYAPKSPVPDQQ